MSLKKPLTIAIESAVSGGSLALFRGQNELDNRLGDTAYTRAEELLPDIDVMLRNNGQQISEVGFIAVSAGPGSFTGIRIGFATALGLSTGLDVKMASESALRAMAFGHLGHKKLVVALPVGRKMVCSQVFDTSEGLIAKCDPTTQEEQMFLSSIYNDPDAVYLLHNDLFQKSNGSHPLLIDFGRNIASAIARACMVRPRPQSAPIFVSKNIE